MKTNSQQSFLFVSKYSSKQFPLHTQFRPFPPTYSNTCSTQTLPQLQSKPTSLVTWCIWEIKSTFPNRQTKVHSGHSYSPPVVKPTISTPSSTVPSVPWRFLFLFLSALQYLYCQANNNASGLNLKITSQCKHPSSSTAPAHYWTSGVQLFTHYITNVATKPRSLTKQTRPSRLSCQRFSTVWQLNQGHRPSRFSCQCFSNLWQLNQGHRPSRFSCQCFSLQL